MDLKTFLFKEDSIRQTILKNTFWLAIGQVVTRLIKAALIIYAARLLGAGGYGAFSYAFGIVMLFYVTADVGLNSLVMREAAKESNEASRYVSHSFFLKIIFVVGAAVLIYGLAPYLARSPAVILSLRILILYLIFDSLKEFFVSLARAKEKMQLDALVNALESLVMLVVGIPLIVMNPSPSMLALAYGLGAGTATIVSIIFAVQYLKPLVFRLDASAIKTTLSYSFPLAVGTVIFSILGYTDTIMLGWLRSDAAVGWYTAAWKIPQVILAGGAVIGLPMFPLMARSAESDLATFKKAIRQSIQGLYLFGVPLTIGGWIVASRLIPALYGSGYQETVQPFQILISTLPVIFPMVILNLAAFAKNLQHLTVRYAALATGTNIILNYMLIRQVGVIGAAIATLLSYTIYLALIWRLLNAVTQDSLLDWESLAKISLASLIMGAGIFVFLSVLNVWLIILLGAIIYLPVIWKLRPSVLAEIPFLAKYYP